MSQDLLIVPAVLAKSYEELAYSLNRVKDFAPLIHIDVADGEFVVNKTVGPEALRELAPDIPLEIHLMVKNPLAWVSWYNLAPVQRIIFHAESLDDSKEVIDAIRHQDLSPAFCLNPGTPVSVIKPFVDRIDLVQIMTVHPGKQGSALMPETLGKLNDLKRLYPDLPLSIDGGVHTDTIARVLAFPLDQIVVGSAVSQADNPQVAYEQLVAIAVGK